MKKAPAPAPGTPRPHVPPGRGCPPLLDGTRDSFDDGPSDVLPPAEGLAGPQAGRLAPTAVGGLAVATRISIAGFHSGGAGVRDPRHIHAKL
jgi:hypothetical protein